VARLILDSTLIIAAERANKVLNQLISDDDDVAIAAVTAAELLVGVELADDGRRASRVAFVRSVLDTIPVEDYDLDVARAHAVLLAHTRRTGRPRGAHDLMIAATAIARERIVVSADVAAFHDLPGVAVRAS
jgi:tRNA(fMet)-specific endonuclease VapC